MADSSSTSIDTADVLAVDATVQRATDSAGFGITQAGFVPKPFARLLAEKLALAQQLLGDDIDLTSGSVLRRILEVSALEDARTWAALATTYDSCFVSSAGGDALSRLGAELGLPRPFLEARGSVTVRMHGTLPATMPQLVLPRGSRMLTPGGHHVATLEPVTLSPATTQRQVAVAAFYPGPEHNLDPSDPQQRIDRWNTDHVALTDLVQARAEGQGFDVLIVHTTPLTGGELLWPDVRFRQLVLQAPRSQWTSDALQIAASQVPGVRQVLVRDPSGGLDINQSIFGNFPFMERLFSTERDLGNPYYVSVIVAPTAAAIWDGPDGVRAAVESALEDLRPISIFPNVDLATEVGIAVAATLVVSGLPLPTGTPESINASQIVQALKAQVLDRLRGYVEGLGFGEPVRAAEVTRVLLETQAVVDVQDLALQAFPPLTFGDRDFFQPVTVTPQEFGCGANVDLQANQIPVFVDDAAGLVIR
jgi:hypothetical protein